MTLQKLFQYFVKKNRSQFTKHWQIYSLQCSKIELRKKETSKSLFLFATWIFCYKKENRCFLYFPNNCVNIYVQFNQNFHRLIFIPKSGVCHWAKIDTKTWMLIRKIKDQNIVSFCHLFTYKSDHPINYPLCTLILARFFGKNPIKSAIKCFWN